MNQPKTGIKPNLDYVMDIIELKEGKMHKINITKETTL